MDGILNEYDVWESEKNRLLADDIRIVYKRLKDLQREIARQENERTLAARRKDDLDKELEILDGKKKEIDARLIQAKVSLEQLDSTRMIAEEERRYQTLTAEKTELTEKCRRLEHFQTVISEMMVQLSASGEDKSILASLCQQE